MFAKLKKKIENEGGFVPENAIKSSSLRDSVTSLPRAGSIQHLGVSPPGSIADDSVSVQDESTSRDEILYLLHKKSEQCKKLEGNVSDLAALVKEKSKTVDKLETVLKQQEDNSEKQFQDLKEEFDHYKEKVIDSLKADKEKLDKLVKTETDLKTCQSELITKTRQCQEAKVLIEKLVNEIDPLRSNLTTLEFEIAKLKEENKERADLVISLSKDRNTFEKRLYEADKSTEEKEIQVFQLQTQLFKLQEDYQSLMGASNIDRNKANMLIQEKDDHINRLQERVATLETRISDFSLSGDDQLTALQTERNLMDQKLCETRLQVSETRSLFADKVLQLENQISSLNAEIIENNEKLTASHKTNDHMRESFQQQLADLRNRLEEAEKRALENLETSSTKERYFNKQVEELENELTKQKLQAINNDSYLKATVASLDKQILEVETCRKIEQEEAKFRINQFEELASRFADKEIKYESQVKDLEACVNKLQAKIVEKDTEIDILKQQIQDRLLTDKDQTDTILNLQKKISQHKVEYGQIIQAKQNLEESQTTLIADKERLTENNQDLSNEIETLRSITSESKLEFSRIMDSKTETEAALREKLESFEQMLKQSKISEEQSDQHSEKIDELNKTILLLQTQLSEKSKTLKKQEQTLKDLRVTLQRELKVQLLPNDEGLDVTNSNNSVNSPAVSRKVGAANPHPGPRLQESQKQPDHKHNQFNFKQSNLIYSGAPGTTAVAAVLSVQSSPSAMLNLTTSSPSTMLNLTASSSCVPSSPTDALTLHTDHVKRELDKDINFLYLKHVILKFMLSRESEALHLIKAVSMLLNFTHQEQQLIKETLEYKMSWFGHRPSVGAGQTSKVIPPAL